MTHGKSLQKSNTDKHQNMRHIKYRADIDGLRAIAILSVIGFHAFPDNITGGFVGVDIFFVISGFLISSIIFRNLEKNSFSYIEFYARRVKRIFPALLLVLVTSLTIGWFVLLPGEYKQLGSHVAAGAGFVSNLVLWGEIGYFNNAADTKPLLHLWSLGIEEQFYILWPIVLSLAWKWKHNFIYITLIIAIASFAINIFFVGTSPSAVFFFPITRFWELMIGGILAFIMLHKPDYLPRNTNYVSIAGLFFILLGIFLITKEKSFPGWWALLPTMGTFLVISSGSSAWLNRNILGNRYLVWVGLISYPLYLWHWPLLSFVRIIEEKPPAIEMRIAAISISVVFAWLTYKLIERPIQRSSHSKIIIRVTCTLMVIVGVTGYITYWKDGFRTRPSIAAYANTADAFDYQEHWSDWHPCRDVDKSTGCKILNPDQLPDTVVIGDSHAGHLASGLGDLYLENNKNITIRLAHGCMPFYPIAMNGKDFFACRNSNIINNALESSIASDSIKTIILSGYGNFAIYGLDDFLIDKRSHRSGRTKSYSKEEIKENIAAFRIAMNATLEKLTASGKKIYFIVDIPELPFNPRECISLRSIDLTRKLRSPCSMDKKIFLERAAEYQQLIAEAEATFPTVRFIHTYKYMCKNGVCDVLVNGNLLYSSRDHLTPYGSRYLVDKIKGLLIE